MYIQREEITEIFNYLDRRKQGYIEFIDFASIKNEAQMVPRFHQRRTTDHPYVTYNSVVVDKPRFNDTDSVAEFDTQSRRALYFGRRPARKSMSPIPSDLNPNYSYGNKTQISDSIRDVLSNSYQREYETKLKNNHEVKLRSELRKPRQRLWQLPSSK